MSGAFGNKGVSIAGRVTTGSFMGKGTSTPGPGQYSVDQRPRTAGGAFGVKTGSSLGINPQTAAKVGPGAYNPSGVGKQ